MADSLGGKAASFSNVDFVRMVDFTASQCDDDLVTLDSDCNDYTLSSALLKGRKGVGGASSGKIGLKISGASNVQIGAVHVRDATGDGYLMDGATNVAGAIHATNCGDAGLHIANGTKRLALAPVVCVQNTGHGVEISGSGSQGSIGAVNCDSNGGRGFYERNGGSANYILVSSASTISNVDGNYDIQSGGVRIMDSIKNSGAFSGALTGNGTAGGTVG